jgi:ActR/RegA family two-component response regulator
MVMGTPRRIITAAEMDRMTPQERADAVDASEVRSWDEVPESVKARVSETARRLGEKRRQRA